MKISIVFVVLISILSFAGQVSVALEPHSRSDDDWLRYDNGSPQWVTWEGTFRGIWFNTEDFFPGTPAIRVYQAEMWFYHDSSNPWETSDFYAELWNGSADSPVLQLDQQLVSAVHYSPVIVEYTSPISVESQFWYMVNTELSAGGWPSSISDGGNGTPLSHSFHSDNFVKWTPWQSPSGAANYFIAVQGIPLTLNSSSWGELKTVFLP